MGLYTITINPEDGSGARTTVSVEVEDDEARVMEVTVKAPTGAGLAARQMPTIDFDLLLRAVSATQQSDGDAAEAPAPTRRNAAPGGAQPPQSTASRGPVGEGPRGRRRAVAQPSVPPSALGGRAYRRMPDDLAEVYAQHQSVTAVAAHYGVPRHTAQGWMNRLREWTRDE